MNLSKKRGKQDKQNAFNNNNVACGQYWLFIDNKFCIFDIYFFSNGVPDKLFNSIPNSLLSMILFDTEEIKHKKQDKTN